MVMLLCFAFMIFSIVGLLATVAIPRHIPLLLFWSLVLTYGLFAPLYAYVAIRVHWLLSFAIIPFEFLAMGLFQSRIAREPLLPFATHSEFASRLNWSLGVASIMIIASYTLVFVLMSREGKRYFKVHAEVELAAEIHRALVPAISQRIGAFEIYGLSIPSGEVGGDLVDTFTRPQDGSWIAYLADVSGHGVSSGVLMAMLKSATRVSLRQNRCVSTMLAEVNEVFHSLKAANSFATLAAISFTEQGGVQVIVAGHSPILHSVGWKIFELDTPGLPIGITSVGSYSAMPVDLKQGELLAIVTDGLTEVFDRKGVELGDRYIKETLLEKYERPLDEIAGSLLTHANKWGPKSDDQSLLLVRRTQ